MGQRSPGGSFPSLQILFFLLPLRDSSVCFPVRSVGPMKRGEEVSLTLLHSGVNCVYKGFAGPAGFVGRFRHEQIFQV
jgi:hypothetical protein